MAHTKNKEIQDLGHPGKWKGIITCAQNTTTHFTGSNYGAGACFIANDAAVIAGNVITFTDGSTSTGAVLFADGGSNLGAAHAVEASIFKVVVHNTADAEIYVLKRNFQIR